MPKVKLFSSQQESVAISEIASAVNLLEDDVRLKLASIYPDFDTLQSIPSADLEMILGLFPKAFDEQLVKRERDESTIDVPKEKEVQQPTGNHVSQLAAQLEAELQAVDSLFLLRNRVAENISLHHNAELATALNQRWSEAHSEYLQSIHSLAARAKQIKSSPLLANDVDSELNSVLRVIEGK
jgi:hypothetical protein